MILHDPDLDPDPTPTSTSTKKPSASSPSVSKKHHRLPSARTLARFLAEAQSAVRLKGEVTILLTTDPAIRKLNRQFRGKDKATDVLSFPAEGVGAEEIAGDLAISVPTALKQAIEQGHPLATEIKVLILHGLLHLAGYDHEADEGKMARREGQLRARLGLPHGLIERTEAPLLGKRAAGAKARVDSATFSARLKSCPDTRRRSSGAKARIDSKPAFRGLKAPAPSDKNKRGRKP